MANSSVLAKLAVQISANTAQFNTSLAQTQKDLSSFTAGITKMAGALGVAFGVRQVAAFTVEVSRLSGEAEAVSAAFRRLPDSVKLMSELKRATGGTVSELELMKRAVQASNFDISLKALPRLLEFATLRAQQTGQSVDYLVDSIVTGIGRKSKLILDNLGISAVQLTEALGGASAMSSSIEDVADAVGRIAEKNLANMEKFAENASTKMQRLAASWENLKVAMGDAANGSGVIGKSINMWTRFFDALAGDEFTVGFNKLTSGGLNAAEALERFARAGGKIDLSWQELLARGFVRTEEAAKKFEKVLAQIAETQKNLAIISSTGEIDPSTGLPTSGGKRWDPSLAEKHIESLSSLKEKEEELLAVFAATDATDKKKLENLAAEILAIREKTKAIEDLLKVQEKIALSQTAQRALAGDPMTGVTSMAGPGSTIPVDMDAMFNKMRKYQSLTQEVTQDVSDNWIDLGGAISGVVADIAAGLGRAMTGAEDFGDAILQSIGGFMQQFGGALIAMGIGKLSLEKFSGPGMIAAGFALAAAGAALSESARSEARSIGSNGGRGGSSLGRGASAFDRADTSVQNSAQLVTVLKGEDLWIVLQNYQANNRYTHG